VESNGLHDKIARGDGRCGRTRSTVEPLARPDSAIRPATDADIALLDRRFPEPESRHQQRGRRQAAGDGSYLVAWIGIEPVGWVFVSRPGCSPRSKQLAAAELVDLQVVAEHRGRGIGRALMDAAERLALEAGWTRVGLAVTVANPNNRIARDMYARRGYADSGLGEFQDGYVYWDADGRPQWDGEPHLYLVKELDQAGAAQ
jgi:GNAT superfamily N-acetyltransferase